MGYIFDNYLTVVGYDFKMSVSFSFNKKSSKKSLVRVDDSLNEKKDFVTSVEDQQIQSQNCKPVEKKDYFVPLIKKVNWRVSSRQQGAHSSKDISKSEEELELDKEAAAAIMKDLQQARDNITDDDNNGNTVPLLMQNKAPVKDDSTKADVELRPDESTLNDYNDMPVSQFGIACLRGMGWKKSEGIGLTNKQCVEPIEFIQRSAGQGLGATLKPGDAPRQRKLKPGEEARKVSQPIREKSGRVRWVKTLDEEVPEVIEGYNIGAYVTITSGAHNGLLGKIVEGDNNAGTQEESVSVRLSLNKQVIQCNVGQLQLLSVNELQQLKDSRKKSRMKKYGLIEMQGKDNEDDDVICLEDSLLPQISDDQPAAVERTVAIEKGHKHKKKRHKDHTEGSHHSHKKHASSKLPPPAAPVNVSWLCPNLRVRIISKNYCRGRYYNHKVNIVDVTNLNSCMCRTDDGNLLDNLHQDSLETLIPKEQYAHVMIVNGKHKQKLAIVLERNSSKAIITVQLEDTKEVLTLSYDDVCQCTTITSHVE